MNKAGDIFYFIDNISFVPLDSEKLCTQYFTNIENLFSQNLRHTERTLIDTLSDIITDTITIPAVYFETDKAILNTLINKLANKNIVNLTTEGHTDKTGEEERNITLSKQGVDAVLNYFIFKMPILKNNIIAIRKASNAPIASNSMPQNLVKRKIEESKFFKLQL